jgi:hypothetical protein
MKDIVEKYWSTMFREYVIRDDDTELLVSLPEFPEPLMSPRFARSETPSDFEYLNIVSEDAQDGFFLHIFKKDETLKEEIHFSIEPLEKAIQREAFWDYQNKNYSDSLPFIQKLLPFLALKGNHHHVYLGTPDNMTASVIVGETKAINFFFNASIAQEFRGLGLMKMLFNSMIARFEQKQSFYWTIHPWLSLNAAASLKYRVLKPSINPVN